MSSIRRHPSPLPRSLEIESTPLARIRHWARVDPGRHFVTDVGGASLSYGEFEQLLQRWCSALQARGIQHGDRVVSLLPPSIDACLLWFGCALLGAIEVPVNRELRGEFLRHPLRDAAPTIVFVRPEDAALVRALPEMANATVIELPRGEHFAAGSPPLFIDTLPQPEDIATIIYTSGTTGAAKGVLVTWAQLSTTIDRIPFGQLSASDVAYAPWPMFHVTGRTPIVSMAYFGGAVVFREKLSISHFWDDVRTYGCTTTTVATAAPMLLAQPEQPGERDNPLRYVFGSAAAHISLEFQRRFDVKLAWTYGSTEAGFPIINGDMTAENADIAGWLREDYEARICDPEGNDIGFDKPGELWIKPTHPAMICAGYFNRPDATAAALVDGWYRTGDALIRRSSDGGFKFVDRIRDTIRRFGENLSSTALENAVAEDAAVTECCAFGIPSPVAGQAVVLVFSSPLTNVDLDSFYARLTTMLPKHMLPSFIVVTDEFPKTATHKIQKNLVAAAFDRNTAWHSPAAERDI